MSFLCECCISILETCCPKSIDDHEKKVVDRGLVTEEKGYTYTNVTGNVSSHPRTVFRPSNKKELEDIVKSCVKEERKMTISGFGHSTAPLLLSTDALILTENLQGIKVNVKEKTVYIESGVNIQTLNTALAKYNLCIPHTPVSNAFHVIGCIGSGSHGSGIRFHGMSDMVTEVEIIDGNGEWKTLTKKDDDMFLSAITSLGSLGFIYSVTMRVEDAYNVRVTDSKLSLQDCFSSHGRELLQSYVMNNEACDWNYFVYNDDVWIHRYSQTKEDISLCECGQCICTCSCCHCSQRQIDYCLTTKNSGQRLEDALVTLVGQQELSKVLDNPSEAPNLSKFANLYILERSFVTPVINSIHWTHLFNTIPVKFLEIAFACDDNFNNVFQAWKLVLDALDKYKEKGIFPVNSMVQLRFTGDSKSILGELQVKKEEGRKIIVCWIEMVTFVKYGDETKEFDKFAGEVGLEWMKLTGARPHWGKQFTMIPGIIDDLHSKYASIFRRFIEVKRVMDPKNLFLNPYTKELLKL